MKGEKGICTVVDNENRVVRTRYNNATNVADFLVFMVDTIGINPKTVAYKCKHCGEWHIAVPEIASKYGKESLSIEKCREMSRIVEATKDSPDFIPGNEIVESLRKEKMFFIPAGSKLIDKNDVIHYTIVDQTITTKRGEISITTDKGTFIPKFFI